MLVVAARARASVEAVEGRAQPSGRHARPFGEFADGPGADQIAAFDPSGGRDHGRRHAEGVSTPMPAFEDQPRVIGAQRGVPRDHLLADLHIGTRSEEHTSELQSLMRISYAVFCLKKKKNKKDKKNISKQKHNNLRSY